MTVSKSKNMIDSGGVDKSIWGKSKRFLLDFGIGLEITNEAGRGAMH
jgi:hypothetical protein